MPQNPPEPRRWSRFSLRTMLVVVVVISIPLAWVGYSLNWIRQRHEVLNYRGVWQMGNREPAAPMCLWVLGENGVGCLTLPKNSPLSEEEVKRLFPETIVFVRNPPWPATYSGYWGIDL